MTIRLGLARTDEAATIARLSRVLIEQGLPEAWSEQRVLSFMRNRETVTLAARDRRQLIGFALMEFLDAHAHLNLIAVLPGWQRRGVGRQLIEWLESTARTAGVFQVRLELRAGNDTARRFYERLGYGATTRRRGYYAGREDALGMARDLTVTQALP